MKADNIRIREERISAEEYIDFLKRTDLGSQYPKERFAERIAKLVKNVSISLVARNEEGTAVGVLFGLTDFCYWLYVTDLGVDHQSPKSLLHQDFLFSFFRFSPYLARTFSFCLFSYSFTNSMLISLA